MSHGGDMKYLPGFGWLLVAAILFQSGVGHAASTSSYCSTNGAMTTCQIYDNNDPGKLPDTTYQYNRDVSPIETGMPKTEPLEKPFDWNTLK